MLEEILRDVHALRPSEVLGRSKTQESTVLDNSHYIGVCTDSEGVLLVCKLCLSFYRSHGPFYPRIYKRRKGQRLTGKKVTHIVTQMMTTDMVSYITHDHCET